MLGLAGEQQIDVHGHYKYALSSRTEHFYMCWRLGDRRMDDWR